MPAFHSRRAMVRMLAPPTLWALHFLACYVIVSLAAPTAPGRARCGPASRWPAAPGWRRSRRSPGAALASGAPRAACRNRTLPRFFAVVTLMLCALSALALAWVALPGFMLPPCVA